jgi:hypothetical protein
MRAVCQLNVIKDVDPRLCILRRTKQWKQFTVQLLGSLGAPQIALLRAVCIVMLNLYRLERPNPRFRQELKQMVMAISERRKQYKALIEERRETQNKLSHFVTTKDVAAKRAHLQSLINLVHQSVVREEAKRKVYTGSHFFPYFSELELEAADEIRVIRSNNQLDETGNILMPEMTKNQLQQQLASIRVRMTETGKDIAEKNDHLDLFQKRMQWRWDRLNQVIKVCSRYTADAEFDASVPEFDLATADINNRAVVKQVFAVVSASVKWCARVLFALIQRVCRNEGYYLERIFFWDILMCYHMAQLMSLRIAELPPELQLLDPPKAFVGLTDLFADLWSPRGVMLYYPDFRYQCLYTVGRLFQLRGLFYLDYGVVSKNTEDVLMQVIETFVPKKYQFTRSGDITEEYIRGDVDSMAIPFLVSVIAFFRIGLYYQCSICVQDNDEYVRMLDLFARRHMLHSDLPVAKKYLDYVVQFFTRINPGMSVVAVNEYIMRNYYFCNASLDAMNLPYRNCRIQIYTVCDSWRHRVARGLNVEQFVLMMYFIKSQMPFHREAMQVPVDIFMMIFHRNTLEIGNPVYGTKNKPSLPVDQEQTENNLKRKADPNEHVLEDETVKKESTIKTEQSECEEMPEPARIMIDHRDQDEADRVMDMTSSSSGLRGDLARRAILGKRSVKQSATASVGSSTPGPHDGSPSSGLPSVLKPGGGEQGDRQYKKKNRSSVSSLLASRDEQEENERFADEVIKITEEPELGKTRNGYSGLNTEWFSFLVRTTALYDQAANIGAIMTHKQLLPHEEQVLEITGLIGQPARRFISAWRFAVLVGYPMGMNAEDECMLLVVLHDFCKQLGPSTLLNAVRKACVTRPIISYIALLWKRLTNFTWAPISSQDALIQRKAIAERLQAFEIPEVTTLEYLLYCPVCGFVRTIHNTAMKIDSNEEMRVVDSHKVMGFTAVKVYMLPWTAEAMCARTGLAVSSICQGTRCLYVPMRYRVVYRTEQSQQWRVCGCCGILSMRDAETYFALTHPTFGELCSFCSIKFSRSKPCKDNTVFNYKYISRHEAFGLSDGLKGDVE